MPDRFCQPSSSGWDFLASVLRFSACQHLSISPQSACQYFSVSAFALMISAFYFPNFYFVLTAFSVSAFQLFSMSAFDLVISAFQLLPAQISAFQHLLW
jgi:hypothetical protein